MLSCDTLGSNGRLGNQLFQYASLKGIANNKNYKFCIPKEGHDLFKIFKPFKDVIFENKINNIRIQERYFHFDNDLFENIQDGVDLYGYFQTEKYFKNIEQQIRQDFKFKDEILESATLFFDKLESENIGSIHVRRGDYVNLQHYHGLCSPNYYQACLENYKEDKSWKFIVFSDDIEWCKNIFRSDRFIFSENNSSFVDLCLMSMCKHNIIANSSFSWWAAWLNQNKDKKVYAPSKWFASNGPQDTQDIYCKDWIII